MKQLKYLLLVSSLLICNAYGAADEESKPDETILSTHFGLGAEPFDETVVKWHQAIAAKCLTVSEQTKGTSNLHEVCLKMCQEGFLNKALEDPAICARAKGHYAVLQENSDVIAALAAALAAKEAEEDKVERAKKWTHFRKTTAHKLKL